MKDQNPKRRGRPFVINQRDVADRLRILQDVSLPLETRRESEAWLSLRQRLPDGWQLLPEIIAAPRELPDGTVISHMPAPENYDHLPAWGQMIIQRASNVVQEEIQWTYPDRFAAGKINVLAGDMGLGKSMLAAWMMSIITRGDILPQTRGSAALAGHVIYMAGEDDAADTIVPRLDRAGADLDRVHLTTTVRFRDGSIQPFCLTRDLQPLADMLDAIRDVRLLIIDPVSDYLFGVDENKNSEVRKALNPLRDLARKYRVCVLLINHLNKGGGLKALYRISGTHAFVGVGRMNWLVVEHPYDNSRRLLVPIKANLTGQGAGLSFRITGPGEVVFDEEPVEWDADTAMRLVHEEKYGEGKPRRGREAQRTKQAMELITKHLGKGPSCELRKVCKEAKISASTYLEALKRLKDQGKVVRVASDSGAELFALAPGTESQQSLPLIRAEGLNGHHSNGSNGTNGVKG